MQTSQLQYPVIIFNKAVTGIFDTCTTEEALLLTTPLALKERMHLDSIIVDMTGCRYSIESVQRIAKGKLSDLLDDVLNRPIKIQMSLSEDCVAMTVFEVSSRVRVAFQNASFADVWETSGIDAGALNAFLDRVATVPEIILFLSQEQNS